MNKILITGATGYIGRRLKEQLLSRTDLEIRLLVRNRNKVRTAVLDRVETVEGDTFNQEALDEAVRDRDTAFYLIHSMGAGKNFEDLDRRSAENFRDACIRAGVKRIIYLGGLGVKKTASRHLLSRIETGEILSAFPERIQTIWFRAGVIVGAGSASFEIIRNLIQKLPIMVTPRWVKTRTQPIAVGDVVSYLEAAITLAEQGNLIIDIGTAPMSFKEMLLRAARVMGLRRFLIPVPVLSPKLSAYWLILFTPVPFKIAAALVEGLRSETLVLHDNARQLFPEVVPCSYEEAVRQAMAEIEQDQVLSRWCDSSADTACDIKDHDGADLAVLRDVRTVPTAGLSPASIFRAVTGIGGEAGWFTYNFLWQLRGVVDKAAGGCGLNRGRRSSAALRPGDALDFWKVADIRENKRLLLLAQMKLPGKAWLEFDIQPGALIQTAHFIPSGVWGRLYWYAVLPFHNLVFADLAERIVESARKFEALADC